MLICLTESFLDVVNESIKLFMNLIIRKQRIFQIKTLTFKNHIPKTLFNPLLHIIVISIHF